MSTPSNSSRTDILTIGHPMLRERAQPVKDFSAVHAIIDTMIQRVRAKQGAGIAAPQIGVDRRIAVVEVRPTKLFPDRPGSPLHIMINPEIIDTSHDMATDWESCFSVPDMIGVVPRHQMVVVRYATRVGEIVTQRFEGYVARVVQHEVDHLEGILYTDRMDSLGTFMTRKNYVEFHMKSAQQ